MQHCSRDGDSPVLDSPAFPTALTSPLDAHDAGRGPMFTVLIWVFTVLATTVVGLRFYTRRKLACGYCLDDWIMLISLVVKVVFSSLTTVSIKAGLGKHDKDMPLAQLIGVFRDLWILLPGSVFVCASARVSIGILLARLFAIYTWFKWCCIGVSVFQALVSAAFIPLGFLRAQPVEALWDFTMRDTWQMDPRVWDYYAIFLQSLWTFCDLVFVVFPVMFICRLRLPTWQKGSVVGVIGLSLVTMAMSILKAVTMTWLSKVPRDSTELHYNGVLPILYGSLEECLVIIMGCIPTLRGVFVSTVVSMGGAVSNLVGTKREKQVASRTQDDVEAECCNRVMS
ncbi:hypothetical protein CDD82_3632 [Ophiocordyceps australis]|uniref:Rhodopsin domain-containing protein n=1 Tax=Ophiocordyceps australis TaxID=1399860 RepID=A0A2C5Z5R0_9HYPO|nr:hypothetical protein CDD82_3632 [Ophiocordyceps australis]